MFVFIPQFRAQQEQLDRGYGAEVKLALLRYRGLLSLEDLQRTTTGSSLGRLSLWRDTLHFDSLCPLSVLRNSDFITSHWPRGWSLPLDAPLTELGQLDSLTRSKIQRVMNANHTDDHTICEKLCSWGLTHKCDNAPAHHLLRVSGKDELWNAVKVLASPFSYAMQWPQLTTEKQQTLLAFLCLPTMKCWFFFNRGPRRLVLVEFSDTCIDGISLHLRSSYKVKSVLAINGERSSCLVRDFRWQHCCTSQPPDVPASELSPDRDGRQSRPRIYQSEKLCTKISHDPKELLISLVRSLRANARYLCFV